MKSMRLALAGAILILAACASPAGLWTGSYDNLAWTVIPLCIACAVSIMTLGPYPEQRETNAPALEPHPALG